MSSYWLHHMIKDWDIKSHLSSFENVISTSAGIVSTNASIVSTIPDTTVTLSEVGPGRLYLIRLVFGKSDAFSEEKNC